MHYSIHYSYDVRYIPCTLHVYIPRTYLFCNWKFDFWPPSPLPTPNPHLWQACLFSFLSFLNWGNSGLFKFHVYSIIFPLLYMLQLAHPQKVNFHLLAYSWPPLFILPSPHPRFLSGNHYSVLCIYVFVLFCFVCCLFFNIQYMNEIIQCMSFSQKPYCVQTHSVITVLLSMPT